MNADGAFNHDWFARMTNITARLHKISETKMTLYQIENLRCSEWCQGSRILRSDHFLVYPSHTLQRRRQTKINVIHYITSVISLVPYVHEAAPPRTESVKCSTIAKNRISPLRTGQPFHSKIIDRKVAARSRCRYM